MFFWGGVKKNQVAVSADEFGRLDGFVEEHLGVDFEKMRL